MLGTMARPAFTLAALATAALPGIEVVGCRSLSSGMGNRYDTAVVEARDAHWYVLRIPLKQSAESEQSAELVALGALSEGARSRLPFAVPVYRGQTPVGPTRAVLYDFVSGTALTAEGLTSDADLATSVGKAIASIHSLPTSVVSSAGLPSRTAAESRADVRDLLASAAATGRVPNALVERWNSAVNDDALWQFVPRVTNGQLAADSILIEHNQVAGIIGWSGLSVDDPAKDVFWLLSARGTHAHLAIESYLTFMREGTDSRFERRCRLYSELELLRWLMHGLEQRDEAIIADAVNLLDSLVQRVHDEALSPVSGATGPIMTIGEVERLLDQTPTVTQSVASNDTESSSPETEPIATQHLIDATRDPIQIQSSVDDVATEPIFSPQSDENSASS